jgi:energy-converting hydrogenase Eha subunit A
MKKSDYLDATDIVYFPATLLAAHLLGKWLPNALATAVAVILILSILYIFQRLKRTNSNSFLLPVLAAGIVALIFSLLGWPGV